MMLNKLRKIVQEVSAATQLDQALKIIVSSVQAAMSTDVCSIYLLDDKTDRYLLMATQGLNPDAIGRAALAADEGLVGMVGSREEPINLLDAQSHPRYRYLPETGEERYRSFLGVPVIHNRKVLGVLVVQQQDNQRCFDEGEEAFLVTISAQLAGIIAHAEATGVYTPLAQGGSPQKDICFNGVAGAPGVGIGCSVVVLPAADLDMIPDDHSDDTAREKQRFLEAIEAVRKDVRRVSYKLKERLRREEQALFDVYLRMLQEQDGLSEEIQSMIAQGKSAQVALRDVIKGYVFQLESIDDDYLRERAVDLRDLGRRILGYLQKQEPQKQKFPDRTILVTEELSPTLLGEIPADKLVALVALRGSGNSHAAIVARAMGVPTAMGVVDFPITRLHHQELIVDGYNGQVFVSPSDELRGYYQKIVEEEAELARGLETLRDCPGETRDSHRVPLWVNTGLTTDAVRSATVGAEGIGLYRTEVPFMINERFPSEQEQVNSYREQLAAVFPRRVTMRTLDIGGDKTLSYFPIDEENPFLGWRGIRVTLDHPEIFLVQIRAMLRASEGLNNLRIMLPMISNMLEVHEALGLIRRVCQEVQEEGFKVTMPPVGVMVEVPASVYQIRALAGAVDFLSVGSNDLTQYLLAVDRNNSHVAGLYYAYHPAVLQVLKQIAAEAHDADIEVSICGELAGDPCGAVLLMAMGYDALSMNAASLPRIKKVIRSVTLVWAVELLDEVLHLEDPVAIQKSLEGALRQVGMGGFLRPPGGKPADRDGFA